MTIIYTKNKRTKPANTKANRELAAAWEKICASHQAPLVKGAKANGIKVKVTSKKRPPVVVQEVETPIPTKTLPVPLSAKATGVLPVRDELAEAKAVLKARVGQVFNKGGLQYLTDSDLADGKAGLLRRRS